MAREAAQPPYQQPQYTINNHAILSRSLRLMMLLVLHLAASKRCKQGTLLQRCFKNIASNNVGPAAAIVWEKQNRNMMP